MFRYLTNRPDPGRRSTLPHDSILNIRSTSKAMLISDLNDAISPVNSHFLGGLLTMSLDASGKHFYGLEPRRL